MSGSRLPKFARVSAESFPGGCVLRTKPCRNVRETKRLRDVLSDPGDSAPATASQVSQIELGRPSGPGKGSIRG